MVCVSDIFEKSSLPNIGHVMNDIFELADYDPMIGALEKFC